MVIAPPTSQNCGFEYIIPFQGFKIRELGVFQHQAHIIIGFFYMAYMDEIPKTIGFKKPYHPLKIR
jgi:hypothetical protein